MIVDGGATPVGLESTIVKVEGDALRLLRPGGIAAEDIEAVAGCSCCAARRSGVEAPGMLASHYAPGAAVRLDARARFADGEALLASAEPRSTRLARRCRFAQPVARPATCAKRRPIFSHLQDLDRSGATTIAVEPIPAGGLGEAINDRLCARRRAA